MAPGRAGAEAGSHRYRSGRLRPGPMDRDRAGDDLMVRNVPAGPDRDVAVRPSEAFCDRSHQLQPLVEPQPSQT